MYSPARHLPVRRLAQSAAQLAAEKMQIPAKYSQSLPAAIPLSVPTSRTALAAAAVKKAQQEAAAVADLTGVKADGDFKQQRESLISGIASGLADLQGKAPGHGYLPPAAICRPRFWSW